MRRTLWLTLALLATHFAAFSLGVTYDGDFIPMQDKVVAGECTALDLTTGRFTPPWPKNHFGRCYLSDNAWGHIEVSALNLMDALGDSLMHPYGDDFYVPAFP